MPIGLFPEVYLLRQKVFYILCAYQYISLRNNSEQKQQSKMKEISNLPRHKKSNLMPAIKGFDILPFD